MGKGKAKRRRAANVLKAKQLAKGLLPMAPTRKKRKGDSDDVPASIKKIMLLKELSKTADPPAHQHNNTTTEPADRDSEQDKQQHEAAEDRTGGAAGGSNTTAPQKPVRRVPAGLDTGDATEDPFGLPKSGMRPRRKEYLKMKKLKKKQKGKPPANDLETILSKDPNRPRFGEQAQAPIKVHLKRKHWDPNSEEKRAGDRCKEVFLRQMAGAQRMARRAVDPELLPNDNSLRLRGDAEKNAARLKVIEAYRAKKRLNGGGPGVATQESLAELVRRDAVAASRDGQETLQ